MINPVIYEKDRIYYIISFLFIIGPVLGPIVGPIIGPMPINTEANKLTCFEHLPRQVPHSMGGNEYFPPTRFLQK